jgi:putative ABC transport system permease protein
MLLDLKFTLRSLLKAPVFTAVAIVTVALGIGATVAIFSVVNTVLLKPLPYGAPEQLARIYTEAPNFANGAGRRGPASTNEYFELARDTQSWESIDAWRRVGVSLVAAGEPLRVTAAFVSGGLFRTLGVGAALGRVLGPDDDTLTASPVVVISHGLWQRAFGGDRAVLGRDVSLNGSQYTLIGVLPEQFDFPVGEAAATDVWVTLRVDPAKPVNDHSVFLVGRLKPGRSLAAAQAELDALVQRDAGSPAAHHLDPREHPVVTYGLRDETVRGVLPALEVLLGAVGFLLLIACVNVANLLLSRAEARQHELAIRSALGARVRRLAAQFAVEGVLLSALGAALGVLLAAGGLRLLRVVGPAGIPQALDAQIDGRVLLFAVVVSLSTGLAFGLTPLLQLVRRSARATTGSLVTGASRVTGTQRLRQALIVGQLALALILLTGTGLMLRTFWNLQRVEAGFDPAGTTTMQIALPEDIYSGAAAPAFWTRALERFAALPGVEGVALTSALPPVAEDFGWGTLFEGYVPVVGGTIPSFPTPNGRVASVEHYQVVSPDYFAALHVMPIAGRVFDARDNAQAPNSLIVNETLARAIWGNDNALGRRVRPGLSNEWFTVVGVIADVKNNGVDRPTGPALYLPYLQVPATTSLLRAPYITVRSAAAQAAVVGAIRGGLKAIDPTLPLARIRSMDEVVAASQSRPRLLTLLLGLFAGVSLALAAVGIYGVTAYAVALRTREFGIRVALGARPAAVLAIVLKRGAWLIAGGVLLGVGGAVLLTRLLTGFLFGVAAADPVTFASVAGLLGGVALLASYVAARRATKVDPLVALRAE